MSELLEKISNEEIKQKAIRLIQSIFETEEEPSEVIISQFTIILEFQKCEDNEDGLNFYSKNNTELTYLKDKNEKLCIVNILSPEVLMEEQKAIPKSI